MKKLERQVERYRDKRTHEPRRRQQQAAAEQPIVVDLIDVTDGESPEEPAA